MHIHLGDILAYLFPPSDDERILNACTKEAFVERLHPVQRRDIWVLASFSEEAVRSAIHLNKYHAHPKACEFISELFTTWLVSLPAKDYVIIPVPLSATREKERGGNQVSYITKPVAQALGFAHEPGSLRRLRHTAPQTSLARSQRLMNLKGAFAVPNRDSLNGKHIMLVDDVSTTGATLSEARKAIAACSPASITCVAFAG